MGLPINFYNGRYKPSKLHGIIALIVVFFTYLTTSGRINYVVGYTIIFAGMIFLLVDLIRGTKSS